MSGPDVEGVLAERYLSFRLHHADLGTVASPEYFAALFVGWTAAAVRAEVRAWLESEGAVSLIAGRMLKVESPDGLWAHLTPLERERFSNHATCALAALAEQVGQVASVGEGEG